MKFLLAALFVFMPSTSPDVIDHFCVTKTRAMVMDVCPNQPDPNQKCQRQSGLVEQTCEVIGPAPPTLPGSDGHEHLTLTGEWYGFSADPMPDAAIMINVCAVDLSGNVACATSTTLDWDRFKWPYP